MLEGHRRVVEKHWEGEKRKGKKPQIPTIQQDGTVGEPQICSLSIVIPYKEENHYQHQTQPVGKACATHMYPQCVSLVTCPCSHRASMSHSMYSCSVFLPRGHGIYMSGETTCGPRSDPPTSTCCKLLPELRERK